MSQAVKVFRVAQGTKKDPIPFAIEFKKLDGEVVTHEFSAYGETPAGVTLLLASVVRFDARGRQRTDLNGLTAFFSAVMEPKDYARFSALLDDPELLVPIETLSEIFEYLCEQYGDRPTEQSSSSSGGGLPTGDGATEPQLSAV